MSPDHAGPQARRKIEAGDRHLRGIRVADPQREFSYTECDSNLGQFRYRPALHAHWG